MKAKPAAPKDVDAYIARFPAEVQKILEAVRRSIRDAAPKATETIRYQIPTFRLHGKNLVHFAGYESHVGVYPAPVGNAKFAGDLSRYAAGKGTVRFPLDEPMPLDLIRQIVKFLVEENRIRITPAAQKRRRDSHA